jgi:hypothetical protein
VLIIIGHGPPPFNMFSLVGCVDRNRETILGVRQFSDAKLAAFSKDLSGTPPIILQGMSGAPGYAGPLGS